MINLEDILTEIVTKIQIDTVNFIISHPQYPSIELPPENIRTFQQISPHLQEKYLTVQLQNYLYDIYFRHSLLSLQDLETESQILVKNNIIDGIDIDFYQQLEQSNSSHRYIDRDWQKVAETPTGEWIIVKDELHIHIDPEQHLSPDDKNTAIGDLVSIYLPHNLVGQDTYITIGNFGKPDRLDSVEIYFNCTPNAVVKIAQELTRELNRLSIPFQFAILHNPTLFYRYDAGKLCLWRTNYFTIQSILAKIYRLHKADFDPAVPLFSKPLASGLGIAEVPITTVDFGMQRCELLAKGLLIATARERTFAVDKLQIISQEFKIAGIDLWKPHLNPLGVDFYDTYVD